MMRLAFFASAFIILSAVGHDWGLCKFAQKETNEHDCRACDSVDVEKEGNCPNSFECSEQQPLRASVLSPDSCECQTIRCADREWKLAVNETVVDKIRCKGKKWVTYDGVQVPSVVCGKEIIAEDLPCPSVPLASAADGFLLSGLTGPTNMNGAKVYSCASADDLLLSVDGTTPTPLAHGAKITCKPNSGIFVLDDGTAVGTKKFNCGQKLSPCPAFLDAPDVAGNDVTKAIMTTEANGDQVWKCEPPSRLYAVENAMPTMAAKKDEGVYVTCKKQSGKLTFSDDPSTTVDPVATSFACGTLPCQKCDMSIFDDVNDFCSGQTAIFCNSKPVVSPGADECPSVTCPGGTVLYLMTSASASEPVADIAQVKCDAGAWKNGATAVPVGFIFVCALAASCDTCDGLIGDVYDEMSAPLADVQMTRVLAKPTCTYTCPQNYKMDFMGAAHQSVVCRIDTGDVTVDMDGGTMLSMTEKFGCTECLCMTGSLVDGEEGLCPMGKLCTKPTTTDLCMAMCPADSSAIYYDSLNMRKPSATIKCVLPNQDWIEPGAKIVTCQYDEGKGYTDTKPPAAAGCADLETFTCTAPKMCDDSQLVYYPSGDSIAVACKKGALITDKGMDEPIVTCSVANQWTGMATQANCVTDDSAVQDCLNMLAPAVKTVITSSCSFGSCYFSCPGTQQFQYQINGGNIEKNAHLKCYFGEVHSIALVTVDAPVTAKCV